MGAVAQQLADEIYVTDDNPRSEQPETIRAAICAQCPSARDLDDRRGAIALAISEMGADDLLVIAGKGHETGQQFSDRTEPFDDRLVAADCLAAEAVKNADTSSPEYKGSIELDTESYKEALLKQRMTNELELA